MDLVTLKALAHELADHRVVSAVALRHRGADGAAIYGARQHGVLQDVPGIDGVYVVGDEPYDDLVRMHVAAAWAGAGALISGLWACRLLMLPWVPEGGSCFVRIDSRYKRRGSEGFVSICRTVRLDQIDSWTHEGLHVVHAPYAVVDAARQVQADLMRAPALRLRDVRGLVLGALANKRCTAGELEQVLGLGSIRYTADTRRALVDASRGAASPPEAEVVDELLGYGVPFYCNVEVYVDGVLVAVLDFYLVGTGVGGEVDSKQEHGDEAKLDATLLRHKTVESFDLDLHHITPTRFRAAPTAYLHTLFAAARTRLAKGLGDPDGIELRPRGPLLCGPRSSLTPYALPEAA